MEHSEGFGPFEGRMRAVIEGVSEVAIRYYKDHEGLGVVRYQAHGGDHGEFDAILKAIFDKTNPVHRLGTLLTGKRILWFDPRPNHNELVRKLFQTAIKDCGEQSTELDSHLVEVTSLEATFARLEESANFDLVISHWGHGLYQGRPNGEELLRYLSRQRVKGNAGPPALIFASGACEEENRQQALKLGAAEYVSRWEDLLEMAERLLRPTYVG
jgi:CheY-like chemotaxis protein